MQAKGFSNQVKGFTLVEIIIGIVVFSLALSIVVNAILPTAAQSANQVQSIRASELGQSMMNEIMAKAFDENSYTGGGGFRCGDADQPGFPSVPACTTATNLGNDGENRDNFNDVDDYDGLTVLADVNNDSIAALYTGFSLSVTVFYDGNYDGVNDGAVSNAKLVTITVTTPAKDQITFAGYKANY